jgi:hypothetical protein
VDVNTWQEVQQLCQRDNLPRRTFDEQACLKSVIHCDTWLRPLTCGSSKRKLKHYWYYECVKHGKSYNVEKAHNTMSAILNLLSFTQEQLQYLYKAIKEHIHEYLLRNVNTKEILQKKHGGLL